MPYILAGVIVAIAVVFGIFVGVWGGLFFIVPVGIVIALAFVARGRQEKVDRAASGPAGWERPARGPTSGTANERVGQG